MSETQLSNRIYYCERCGLRIPPAELQSQRAKIVDENEAVCATCLRSEAGSPAGVASAASPGSQPLIHAVNHSATHASDASHSGKRRNTASHGRGHAQASAGLPWKPALAGAVVVGALLGALVMSKSRKSDYAVPAAATSETKPVEPKREIAAPKPIEKRAEPTRPTPSQPVVSVAPRETPAPETKAVVRPPAPPVDDYDPRKAVADSMLSQAKEFQKKNPEDIFGYRDKLQFLVERYRSTAAGEEATKLLAEIKLPAFDPDLHPELTPEAEWAKATSILGAADPKKDALAGNWSLNNGNLRSDKSTWSKLGLPYTLPEEYDLRLNFTRYDNDCLLIVLARRGKPFIFSIGSGNANVSFEDVREKRKDLVPTKTQHPNLISNGSRQQVVVQVRRGCLRGYLNGKLLVGCQVDDDGLSLNPQLYMPQTNQIGLMTWDSVFDFHSLEILPLKGDGKMLR